MTVFETVTDEIHRSDLVRRQRHPERTTLHGHTTPALTPRHLQSFLAVDPLYALAVDRFAFATDQCVDATVAEPATLRSERLDRLAPRLRAYRFPRAMTLSDSVSSIASARGFFNFPFPPSSSRSRRASPTPSRRTPAPLVERCVTEPVLTPDLPLEIGLYSPSCGTENGGQVNHQSSGCIVYGMTPVAHGVLFDGAQVPKPFALQQAVVGRFLLVF
jgi:hypothetical protein